MHQISWGLTHIKATMSSALDARLEHLDFSMARLRGTPASSGKVNCQICHASCGSRRQWMKDLRTWALVDFCDTMAFISFRASDILAMLNVALSLANARQTGSNAKEFLGSCNNFFQLGSWGLWLNPFKRLVSAIPVGRWHSDSSLMWKGAFSPCSRACIWCSLMNVIKAICTRLDRNNG